MNGTSATVSAWRWQLNFVLQQLSDTFAPLAATSVPVVRFHSDPFLEDSSALADSSEEDEVLPDPPRKYRVLVVEDDPATLNALRAVLTHKGWDVRIASTIRAAIQSLTAEVDCMILDLMLPDGHGTTLLRIAREKEFPVRVVVTTGASDPDLLLRGSGHEPAAVLRKPINLSELLRAIEPPTRRVALHSFRLAPPRVSHRRIKVASRRQ